MKSKTLIRLAVDGPSIFDGSVNGVGILNSERVRVQGGRIRLQKGGLELARNLEMDTLQVFTITASVTPSKLGPETSTIAEGQSPAISLVMDPAGKLTGAINTASGWVAVDSGSTKLQQDQAAQVRFWRDDAGTLGLEVDGQTVGSKAGTGSLVSVGPKGLVVGSFVDGVGKPFNGTIADFQVQQGVVTAQWVAQKRNDATRIQAIFTQKTRLPRVSVTLLPDESHARLQPIKDIMNAAGVQRLSDLDTLKVTQTTTMTIGKVLVAPRKMSVGAVNWQGIAAQFAASTQAQKQKMLAGVLANRNSEALLTQRTAGPSGAQPTATTPPSTLGALPLTPGARIVGIGDPARTSLRLPTELLRVNPSLTLANRPERLSESVSFSRGVARVLDDSLIRKLKDKNPSNWPGTSPPWPQVMALHTIPVNSAVIIAGTLDLTNMQLIVEPNVETLYVIAERVICGNNASITWRRPGGNTPARTDNADLNGRSWSGVQTKADSRDGLDGGDGSRGDPGIGGRVGNSSPKLEVWVKDMSAVPNIDLSGEDGIKGGTGQKGGSGGNGGDGDLGHRRWFFGWYCDTDPGDGGNGGNGGQGGRGGTGGNGGNGGKITIGVLEDTLEDTVTNRSFKIKNQAGRKGRGGDGGQGGAGGRGGRSGVGETCKDAHDGFNGAQGQPGAVGPDGASDGFDGEIQFFEFTQAAWDDLLTRPWLSHLSPTMAFPGDRLTLRGSRFSSNDRVVIDGVTLVPTIDPDESISVTLPLTVAGGIKAVFVRRQDGTESNRVNLWIKPQINLLPTLAQGSEATLTGRAFLTGAAVLVNGTAIPATVSSATQLTFTMPGTGGTGSTGGQVSIQVRNPDGMASNIGIAPLPCILELPFRFGEHNLSFLNFSDGVPDWGTYEDTFGADEVWHELLDLIFGHPILTAAFFAFYECFLKGEANGGLATGFCTSMSALVADRFWQGFTDTSTIQKAQVHKHLTAIHGKLLSRESLLTFHDQGREAIDRVEKTARQIEATFLRGTDRYNAPLVFFIPSGEVWDSGYFDRLGSSHCVMPYKFVYPPGRPAPQLTQDGTSTTTDFDGVELFVWDCNHPRPEDNGRQCRLRFRRTAGKIHFDYMPGTSSPEFTSEQEVTLGTMTNGDYYLADHDLPFSGPFGLTSFIIDFLLSPADLQITGATGLRTGNFGGQIFSQIPDSHPCYLLKGAYLLPPGNAFTRKIVGNAAGKYSFHTIMPDGISLSLEDINTAAGHEDLLCINADASQIRFTPATDKLINLTICRQVGDQARAIAIQGMGGGPTADIDIALSPDLSLVRMGNRGPNLANVEVRAFRADKASQAVANQKVSGVGIPTNNDLTVAVPDWQVLNVTAEAVPFP